MVGIFTSLLAVLLLVFTQISYGKTYGPSLCENSQFYCYKVKRGETWEKLFPDSDQRDLVKRLNRTNNKLYRGKTIVIPTDLENLTTLDLSPLPTQITPSGNKTIYVSLKDLAFGAYDEDGVLQHWGPISGGKGYCPDIRRGCHTITGKFRVYRKEGAGCFSTKFPVGRGGAPMPYCMFFHGGFALHGSYDVPGHHASHGCVRLFVSDAKWLNEEFVMSERNVQVIVKSN